MKFRNNFLLCLLVSFLIIMTVGVAFADEAPAMELVETGTVSGDAHIESANPWKTSGSVEYIIPDNVDEIKSAYAIVNSYSGSGAPTYALYSNITLNTSNGFEVLGYEDLYSEFSMTNDPLVYVVNNHTTKQYSDYQSVFNITEKVKNLSAGDKITVSVENTRKDGYNFDARIKLISIILIYDDGDDDKINYWLNIGQSWTQSTRSNLINTKDFDGEYDEVTFENIGLSTYNALSRINNKLIYDPIYEKTGSYFIDDIWNITNNFQIRQDTNFSYKASTNGYGSFKSNVQLLKVVKSYLTVTSGITPQYKDTIYAGVQNNLTINVKSSQDLNATVKLYNNKNLVFNEQISLKNGINQKLYFIDSKIRPVTANTVNGAKNNYEKYTLVIEDSAGNIVNSTDVSYAVLYNGNLGKDLAYPAFNGTVNRVYNITGDVVVLTQDDSVYAGSSAAGLESTFDVKDSDVVEALLYVSYNWDKIASGDFNSWKVSFNNVLVNPVANYRDQSNLGTYGRYGYGLVVYNVTALVKSGANKLVLNKDAGGSAVYPPSLVLLTDNSKSTTYKLVYIAENADLLSKPANIESGSYTFMDVKSDDSIKSTLYVFAAGAQAGEANVVVNEKGYNNIWNGTSNSLNYHLIDMTNSILKSNKIYFQATGSTILSLHDILVVEFEKITPQLNLSAEDITVGENVNIDVVLPQDATGNVTLNNSTISIKNGKATFVISNLDVGDYKFIVRYSGDDKYNPTSNSVNVHVKENKSVNLTVPEVQKYYKGPERLYVYLKDYNGKPISNASISIKLNGVSYNRQTDKNGVVSMGLGLDSNEYDVDVAFNGSEKYNSAKTTSKVIIKPTVNGTDVVKVFRNGTQYYATFRDSTGKYLANGTKIQFNINGVLYIRSINGDKGLAKLNINLPQGEYVITATNVETGENAANNIKVISRIVENNDLTKYYRNSSQYTVKIIGDDGKAVGKGVEVKFNINGVFYYRTTNESGIAKLNLNLQPGDYIITAEYGDCRVSNNIKILPVLSASDLKMSYRDGSSFKAKLLDGKGIPLANEKIQFNVNGVFYTRTTNSTGVARLNINLMAGEYIITSSYNGANIANTISIRG